MKSSRYRTPLPFQYNLKERSYEHDWSINLHQEPVSTWAEENEVQERVSEDDDSSSVDTKILVRDLQHDDDSSDKIHETSSRLVLTGTRDIDSGYSTLAGQGKAGTQDGIISQQAFIQPSNEADNCSDLSFELPDWTVKDYPKGLDDHAFILAAFRRSESVKKSSRHRAGTASTSQSTQRVNRTRPSNIQRQNSAAKRLSRLKVEAWKLTDLPQPPELALKKIHRRSASLQATSNTAEVLNCASTEFLDERGQIQMRRGRTRSAPRPTGSVIFETVDGVCMDTMVKDPKKIGLSIPELEAMAIQSLADSLDEQERSSFSSSHTARPPPAIGASARTDYVRSISPRPVASSRVHHLPRSRDTQGEIDIEPVTQMLEMKRAPELPELFTNKKNEDCLPSWQASKLLGMMSRVLPLRHRRHMATRL